MTERDYVAIGLKYAQDVIKGKEIACKYVKQACKRHIDDLKRSKSDKTWGFYFEPWWAADVCQFAELLPHVEGKWKTPTITLEPWQVFCFTVIFGWRRREDGGRRFSKVYWEVARKNGKSSVAALVTLYCLTSEDEPAPYVFIGATTGAQALKVFHPAKMMATKTPELCEQFGLKVWSKSITERSGGYVQTINSKASTQDGHNPHLGVLDELHAHKDRALYDVIDSAFGARLNPLMWIITTAGFDTTGVCYEQRTFATKVLDKVVDGDHYFCIIYTLDEDEVELAHQGKQLPPEVWKKANPNLGVSVQINSMKSAAEEASVQPGKVGEFMTKRLNIWTTARRAHINVARWRMCSVKPDLDALRPVECWLGFDLASTGDLTSLRAVWKLDEILYTFGFRYLPRAAVDPRSKKNGVPYSKWERMPISDVVTGEVPEYIKDRPLLTVTDGDTVDYEAIEADIRWMNEYFNVQNIGYDPYNATDLVNRLVKDSLPLAVVRQGGMTLSGPMKELDRLYLNRNFAHGGDEVLSWCASNVVPRPDHNDNLAPSKRLSLEKIDDYSALLNALAAMLDDTETTMDVQDFITNLVAV